MDKMFIFHNYEDLHKILGKKTIRFTEYHDEDIAVMNDMRCALGRDEYSGQIPTAYLVEMFERRAELLEPQSMIEGNHDYVFQNAWQAPVSRELAFVLRYGPEKTV